MVGRTVNDRKSYGTRRVGIRSACVRRNSQVALGRYVRLPGQGKNIGEIALLNGSGNFDRRLGYRLPITESDRRVRACLHWSASEEHILQCRVRTRGIEIGA